MRLEEERKDVRDVLAQCELHWLVGRIPEAKVDEMRDELHLHLREATREGKPIESVVGDDVLAFAESWAREDRPFWPMRKRIAEFGYVLTAMVAVYATLLHLFKWDLVAQVRWVDAVLLLSTVLSCIISLAHVRGVGRPWQASWSAVIGASLLIVGVAWGPSLFTSGEGNRVILDWPWYATLSIVALAVVLGRFRK